LDDLTAEVDGLTTEITGLDTDVSTLTGDVANLETSLAAANTRAANSSEDAEDWQANATRGLAATTASAQCANALDDLNDALFTSLETGASLGSAATAAASRADLWCPVAGSSIETFTTEYEALAESL
jgi:septal ring factor EnvC (AmiA/AmiB activator)